MPTPSHPHPPEREPTWMHDDGPATEDLRSRPISQRLKNLRGLPQEISASYVLWLVSAAYSVILHTTTLFSSVGTYGRGALVLDVPGLIFAILISVAVVYLAIRMKEGAQWARVALTIVCALTVISSLISIMTVGMGIITALTQIVATALMWTAAGQRWLGTSPRSGRRGVAAES